MVQPEQEEKKKGILDRLPKLGRVSQLILLIGGFLIIFIPLWLINQQQPAKQAGLYATLANLQKIVAVSETPKAKFEAELAQVTAETEATKAAFPSSSQAPEIIDRLLELAELNYIYVTQTKVSMGTAIKSVGPVLAVELGLQGQVPKFQNFLLALDTKLPTAIITQVSFTVASGAEAEDTGKVTLEILCYEDSD